MSQEKQRSRLWNLMLYPEDSTHVAAMDKIRAGYQYVAILHDQDIYEDTEENRNKGIVGQTKKPHWHIIIKFTQAHWNTALASELGITMNYMEKAGSWEASALYLLHINAEDKFQYDPTQLEGTLVPLVMKIINQDDENIRVMKIFDLMDSAGILTLTQFAKMCCAAGLYADWRRMGSLGRGYLHDHNCLVRGIEPDYRY